MRWNKQPRAERPEYPKLVALGQMAGDGQALLPLLTDSDPQAEIVHGGSYGLYARVHNYRAEATARLHAPAA